MSKFTKEEYDIIVHHMGKIINEWSSLMVLHVIESAKQNGVKHLFMNTPFTSHPQALGDDESETKAAEVFIALSDLPEKHKGGKKAKHNVTGEMGKVVTMHKLKEYLYNRVPKQLGFVQQRVNIRGNPEKLWYMPLTGEQLPAEYLTEAKRLTEIERRDQGIFVKKFGKKDEYSDEEIAEVEKLKSSPKKQVNKPKPYDGYHSGERNNMGQYFKDSGERVEKLYITKEFMDYVVNHEPDEKVSEALAKFIEFVMSQSKHFGAGQNHFAHALIHIESPDVWVINQIQSDALSPFFFDTKEYRTAGQSSEAFVDTEESIIDRLNGSARTKWAEYAKTNADFLMALRKDKSKIDSLITDTDLESYESIADYLSQNSGALDGVLSESFSKFVKTSGLVTPDHKVFWLKRFS